MVVKIGKIFLSISSLLIVVYVFFHFLTLVLDIEIFQKKQKKTKKSPVF